VEALLADFRAAHTQVLGISVDSVFCHANWARDLGGISFPLLSDFEPKGGVAAGFGLYLAEPGITDRATVIIDKDGIVRHRSSVTPSGSRDIAELAGLCAGIDKEHGQGMAEFPVPRGLSPSSTLFVKSGCGFSRAALLARDNLRLQEILEVKNITDDPSAKEELVKVTGKDQVPCLVRDGQAMHESADIIKHLTESSTDLTL
jgi:glutaredoxin